MKHIFIFCLGMNSSGMMYGIGTSTGWQTWEYGAVIRKNYENRFTLSQMNKNYLKLYGITE